MIEKKLNNITYVCEVFKKLGGIPIENKSNY